MTDTLLSSIARLEAVVAKATPAPWIDQWDAFQGRSFIQINRDVGFTAGPNENTAAIVALRNCAEEILEVVKAAKILQVFLDDDIGMDKTELTLVRASLAALEKKLEGIL